MFGVYSKGGQLGSNNKKPVFVSEDKEVAKQKAKSLRSYLTQGEKKYYKMSFVVKEIRGWQNQIKTL